MKSKMTVSYTQNSEDSDGNIYGMHTTCSHLGGKKHSTQCTCKEAHLADTHTTTVHIYDDMSTLLPYNEHTVVMSNWITNSSLFYLEDGDKFSFISVNFYHTSWINIPFSIIFYHTNLTS